MALAAAQAVIVLGMHRSGTSALTGTLARLGFALPKNPLRDAADNPEGFYESHAIVHENFKLLRREGCAWNMTFIFEPAAVQAQTTAQTFETLAEILAQEFGGRGAFVLKDPRLCLLLPLWFPGIMRLSTSQHVLLLARHPAEVVRSHEQRNQASADDVLLNWLHHMLEAENMSRQLNRAILLYDDLLRDWRATLGQALRTARITPPRALDEAATDVNSFITPGLRHHKAASADARLGPAHLAPLVHGTWRALTALTRNPQDIYALAALDDARSNLAIIRQEIVRQGIYVTLPPIT